MSKLLLSVLLGVFLVHRGSVWSQCLNWSREFYDGPTGELYALTSYDDGNGPNLYVGGDFLGITNSNVVADWIARWDGSRWSGVGGGMDYPVWSLANFDDGSGSALYAGGEFLYAGGVPATRIAKWDGTTWSSIGGVGGAPSSNVYALTVWDDGSGPSLYVGGEFTIAGSVAARGIARWDGSSWYPLGSGVGSNGDGGGVTAIAVYDDGNGPALYVGGYFTMAGGMPANRIARWDGGNWFALGNGVGNSPAQGVEALAVFNDGNGPALYVGGAFSTAGGNPNVGLAKWDGISWSSVGGGMEGPVYALNLFDDGNGSALYAGGTFSQAGNTPAKRIAKWSGQSWSALGDGAGQTGSIEAVFGLGSFNDGSSTAPNLYLCGRFTEVGALRSLRVAKWQSCETPIDSFCFGDGSVTDCPCGNTGLPGHGCENSAGTGGARLYSTGTPNPDTVVLHSTGELASALTIFLQGKTLISSPPPFGDGLRCAGGVLKRLYVKSASSGQATAPIGADLSITARSAALGDLLAPGSTRGYQAYYRDPDLSFCPDTSGGSTFNVGNGVRVVW